MGQKVSPEIFRIEKLNNNWKSKYTENKKKEISAFFFKSLEIKNFIRRFSRFHGLAFHNCKIALSNTTLHVFVSYYITKHSTLVINKDNAKNKHFNDNKEDRKKVSIITKTLIKTYCRCFKTTRILKLRKLLKKKKKASKKKTKLSKKNKLRSFKKKMSFKYLKKKKSVLLRLKKKYI